MQSRKWLWVILYLAMMTTLLNSIACRAMMRQMLMREIREDAIMQSIVRQEMMEQEMREALK